MKYGKDYGIKVDTPWYIRCPLINRLFNTMKVKISLTTFSSDGAPAVGVTGTFRIPFNDHGSTIASNSALKYCFPKNELHNVSNGLYVYISLLDVNHSEVSDKKNINVPLSVGTMAKIKEIRLWLGSWYSDMFLIKFAKRDYCCSESV